MKRSILCFMLLGLLGVCLGCASSSGGNASDYNYTARIGPVTDYDFTEKTRLSLNKYQYEVIRFDDYGNRKYLETAWKDRAPFDDEQELGVVRARSRLVLHATPRTRSMGSTSLFRVEFVGENLVQFVGVEEWRRAPLTDMCNAYFKKWARELKTTFSTGVRRY